MVNREKTARPLLGLSVVHNRTLRSVTKAAAVEAYKKAKEEERARATQRKTPRTIKRRKSRDYLGQLSGVSGYDPSKVPAIEKKRAKREVSPKVDIRKPRSDLDRLRGRRVYEPIVEDKPETSEPAPRRLRARPNLVQLPSTMSQYTVDNSRLVNDSTTNRSLRSRRSATASSGNDISSRNSPNSGILPPVEGLEVANFILHASNGSVHTLSQYFIPE